MEIGRTLTKKLTFICTNRIVIMFQFATWVCRRILFRNYWVENVHVWRLRGKERPFCMVINCAINSWMSTLAHCDKHAFPMWFSNATCIRAEVPNQLKETQVPCCSFRLRRISIFMKSSEYYFCTERFWKKNWENIKIEKKFKQKMPCLLAQRRLKAWCCNSSASIDLTGMG